MNTANIRMENSGPIFKNYSVIFAYLFGSYALGKPGDMSDVDIAVYLEESLTLDQRFDVKLGLLSDLMHLVETDNVDLVILNDSDVLLSYRVILGGKILYSTNELKRIRFEAKAMSNYFDRQYYNRRRASLQIQNTITGGVV